MDKLQELRSEIVQLLEEFCAAIEMPVEELEDDDLLLLGPFAYGMLLAFGRVHGLDASEARALAPDIFHDVFQYAEDQAESVADFLTEAASDPSNQPSHAIIQHGVEGYDQWMRQDDEGLLQNFEEINELIEAQSDDDRLSELIDGQLSGELSPEEQEELTERLYTGTLPTETLPPGFVSKHRMTQTDVVARLKQIDWFARCGEPCDFDLTMEFEWVKTWPQAIKQLDSRAWDDASMEAQNQLTMFLGTQYGERYQQWNEIVGRFKNEVIAPLVEQVWEPFQEKNGLDYAPVGSTMWCVLSALMENAYMDCDHGCFFFLELLTVYEAGHLPCGWRGRWPQGKLVVF